MHENQQQNAILHDEETHCLQLLADLESRLDASSAVDDDDGVAVSLTPPASSSTSSSTPPAVPTPALDCHSSRLIQNKTVNSLSRATRAHLDRMQRCSHVAKFESIYSSISCRHVVGQLYMNSNWKIVW